MKQNVLLERRKIIRDIEIKYKIKLLQEIKK